MKIKKVFYNSIVITFVGLLYWAYKNDE